MIAPILRAFIVRYQYYTINFRYKTVTQIALFFAYKNVTQSERLFVSKILTQSALFFAYKNVTQSAFFACKNMPPHPPISKIQ